MSINGLLGEVRRIAAGLNAGDVRASAGRALNIGLLASSEDVFQAMERFLCEGITDQDELMRTARTICRIDPAEASSCDLVLAEAGSTASPLPGNGCRFHPQDPFRAVEQIVSANTELELALARTFPQFRREVSHKIIHRVSAENGLFSLVSALPNVLPNFLELPWTAGEFATDTAFLTMNQIRMALQLAAAHGRPVGYMEQKLQIAAIAGGAFGWRALARELVGKIPLGGGLLPKAGIAFAGTWVLGLGLERANRLEPGLSATERRAAYRAALERGKAVVSDLMPRLSRGVH